MIIRLSSLFYFLFTVIVAGAQPLSWFTDYREHQGLINPAALHNYYISYEGHYNSFFGLTYRKEGTASTVPKSISARFDYVSNLKLGRIGFRPLFGAFLTSNKFGPLEYSIATFRMAAFAKLGPAKRYHYLSGGISLGLQQIGFNWDDSMRLLEPNDVFEGSSFNQRSLRLGAGLFYLKRIGISHDLFMGVSLVQLLEKDVTLSRRLPFDDFKESGNPHFHVILGGNCFLNAKSYLQPMFWVKSYSGVPLHVNANLRYYLVLPFWLGGGVGILSQENLARLHFEFGFQFGRQLKNGLGFGFDHFLTSLPSQHDVAIELNYTCMLLSRKK